MTSRTLALCGSLTLDVVARSSDGPFGASERTFGTVDMSFGGGASNMAYNLSAWQAKVQLLSVTSGLPVTKLMANALRRRHVKLFLSPQEEMADNVSLHVYHPDGALAGGVVANQYAQASFAEGMISDALHGADALIMTMVFNDAETDRVLLAARNAQLPVYLSVNSVQRARRVPGLSLSEGIAAIFCNEQEMGAICVAAGLAVEAKQLAKHYKTTLVITRGAQSTLVVDAQGQVEEVPVTPTIITGNSLGAGDFIVSRAVYEHVCRDVPLNKAIAIANHEVPAILQSTAPHVGGSLFEVLNDLLEA